MSITQNSLKSSPSATIATADAASTSSPAANIPVRSDHSSLPISAFSPVRTRKVPSIAATTPKDATSIGSSASCPSQPPALIPSAAAPTAASAIVAIIDPT